jgi:hypothetical protein
LYTFYSYKEVRITITITQFPQYVDIIEASEKIEQPIEQYFEKLLEQLQLQQQ